MAARDLPVNQDATVASQMLAWLLHEAGVPATVLGGAALVGDGPGGCFRAGPAEGPVVAEACESDGTLVGYRPAIGVVHNVSRDHGEVETLRPQFATFAESCGRLFVNARCPEATALGRRFKAFTYGDSPDADVRLRVAVNQFGNLRKTLLPDTKRDEPARGGALP